MNKTKIYLWILALGFVLIIVLSGVASAEEYERLWRRDVDLFNLHDATISPDGNHIAVVGGARGVDCMDLILLNKKGELLWQEHTKIPYYGLPKSQVSISSNGNYIVVRSHGEASYFNIEGEELSSAPNCNWYNKKTSLNSEYKVEPDGFMVDVIFYAKSSVIASDKISDAKSTISQIKSKGVVVTEAEEQLSEAEQAFDTKDYKKAKEFAQRAIELTAKLEMDAKAAEESIGTAKSIISDAKSKGFKLSDAENFLSQAENALNSGDYTNAKSLAEQAKEKAEEISKLATPAKDAIDDAKSAIPAERSKGFYSTEADSLLSQAEEAFKQGKYKKAKLLAENATALALDIDQDGVSNEEDFAPTIKNIYIYAGTPFALLVLAALTKVSLDVRKRGKIKRLEKQKIRREEERRRLEYKRRIKELKAKYEQYKREGYTPDKDLEEMLK
ncbi:MAG: hypothetical protein J7J44_06960 [Deltaproteobacteria bacterium]|nr:hypothetical protein [Deltaproteobacteria bacterium]